MESWLTQGITATVTGMFTVFLVLIIIAFVIGKFKYFNVKNKTSHKESSAKAITTKKDIREEDDEQIVAAIMAAISMMTKDSKDKLVVKRIKRID